MSDSDTTHLSLLEGFAKKVQQKLFLRETLGFFRRKTGLFAALAFALILTLRLWMGISRGEALIAVVVLVAGWIIAGIIRGIVKRPGILGALTSWDRIESRKDLFSSAWFFVSGHRDPNRSLPEGQRLHVTRAVAMLPEDVKSIDRAIPTPKVWRPLVSFAIIAVAALTALPQPHLNQGELLLTEEMQSEAAKQSARLKELAKDLEKFETPGEFAKSDLEKLRADVDSAANDLESSDGLTANDILERLEARARATEKLAEKLGLNDNSWASEALIQEMSQHADFADLAISIKDKNAEVAAVEADAIADSMEVDDLKIETRDRITTALERTYEAATEEDEAKPVGERVGNASRKMADKQAKTAAREFEELAKHFRGVTQREENKKKLEELADQLRDAGSQISGSKLEKMEQLAGNKGGDSQSKKGKGPKGLPPVAQVPIGMQPLAEAPQPGQGAAPQIQPGGAQQMPVPGIPKATPGGEENGKGSQPGLAAPVPGQGNQDKDGQKGLAVSQKGGQGAGNQPQGLMAPIPGMNPGGQPVPGAGMNAAAGPAGGNQGSSQAGNGGLEAGQGTAAMGTEASEAMKAGKDATVVAQINKNGESTVKAVEGQYRTEQAQLERQETMANFIAAEEQALDGKSLPMSRKDHVLRYFGEIRRHFEVETK